MESRRHRLRRSQTFSSFHGRLSSDTTAATMTHGFREGVPRSTPPFPSITRARSWAIVPIVDITVTSSTSPMPLSLSESCLSDGVVASHVPAQSSSSASPSTSPLCATQPSSSSSNAQFQSTFIPFVRGVTHSTITYEAILALILSINIRELIGNGADAIVKALAKKAVALTAALLIAMLLDYASPVMPLLGIDALEIEIRGAAGTISGWLGQQASDTIGWKLEKRIAEWLWPKPEPVSIGVNSKEKEGNTSSGSSDSVRSPHAVTPSLLNGVMVIA